MNLVTENIFTMSSQENMKSACPRSPVHPAPHNGTLRLGTSSDTVTGQLPAAARHYLDLMF